MATTIPPGGILGATQAQLALMPQALEAAATAVGAGQDATQAAVTAGGHAASAQDAATSADEAARIAGLSAIGVAAPVTRLSWSGTVTLDPIPQGSIIATLTGNTVLHLPVLAADVSVAVQLKVKQDATGNRTLRITTGATAFGVAPVISTNPNAKDALSLEWDGDMWNVYMGAQKLGVPLEWIV